MTRTAKCYIIVGVNVSELSQYPNLIKSNDVLDGFYDEHGNLELIGIKILEGYNENLEVSKQSISRACQTFYHTLEEKGIKGVEPKLYLVSV